EESTVPAATASRRPCGALDRLLPPGGALSGRIFNRLVAASSDETPLPPGTTIGCWRIGRLLGCGGSALVYLADRADGHFEQQAAIKIVRSDPRLLEQFRRERQLLAELGHPAIARLIDGGVFGDGRPWFAMEHIAGARIDHYVEQRRLSLRDRLVLFEGVCEAIAYAHARGLVHRDIKPGNLLVDENGRPRLLDFGIAMTDGAGEDGIYRAMTPVYASPEQRGGGAVTKASDIYQLGMLLGAMLMPASGLPPRLSECGIGDALRDVVARATAHDPARRFRSVAALRAAVVAIRQRARLLHVRRQLDSHRSARLAGYRETRA
ncbi:MAG TPA: serine/threonine-protein kinase, partial [Rhodanobacteraceae bacterium]|nr:serine/threonine-protein kinase [Rhodanobacteraceae bacterium]